MNSIRRVVCSGIAAWFCVQWSYSIASAAEAYPLFTDVDAGVFLPDSPIAFTFGGIHSMDSAATLNGNAVLAINQKQVPASCCGGAVVEISVSNGENGVNATESGGNLDRPNSRPVNPVFAAIGNPTGKLENGNVVRFSVWLRSDPNNPITIEPQAGPLLKFEFWKEAGSGFLDANFAPAPTFGDKVYDQEFQGYPLGLANLPTFVDVNGDGTVIDPAASASGRLFGLSAEHWSLASVTYTVDTSTWLGIGAEAFGANDVSKIESVKATLFMGDFVNTDFGPDGPNGGNLLVDNALVEVFRNAAAVTPLTNPHPEVPEPGTIGLALLLASIVGSSRRAVGRR